MKHKIAVIAGDGIGQEVMPEGPARPRVAARKFGARSRIHDLRLGQLRLLRRNTAR
jgi:isocitrate/isopropylmalate dehydrogenase